jgi:hypothetical protein
MAHSLMMDGLLSINWFAQPEQEELLTASGTYLTHISVTYFNVSTLYTSARAISSAANITIDVTSIATPSLMMYLRRTNHISPRRIDLELVFMFVA